MLFRGTLFGVYIHMYICMHYVFISQRIYLFHLQGTRPQFGRSPKTHTLLNDIFSGVEPRRQSGSLMRTTITESEQEYPDRDALSK